MLVIDNLEVVYDDGKQPLLLARCGAFVTHGGFNRSRWSSCSRRSHRRVPLEAVRNI